MGCDPKALEHLKFRITNDPANVDTYLDIWWDYTERATEWDADQWGFDPTRWMEKERAEMESRVKGCAEK